MPNRSLLDAALLPRRGYTVRVVGHAPVRTARGETHREIADRLDTPVGTVRGWIRRARRSTHQLWTLGVAAVVALDQDAMPVPIGPVKAALMARSAITRSERSPVVRRAVGHREVVDQRRQHQVDAAGPARYSDAFLVRVRWAISSIGSR